MKKWSSLSTNLPIMANAKKLLNALLVAVVIGLLIFFLNDSMM